MGTTRGLRVMGTTRGLRVMGTTRGLRVMETTRGLHMMETTRGLRMMETTRGLRVVACILSVLIAAGCGTRPPAPVIERGPAASPAKSAAAPAPAPAEVRVPDTSPEFYTVKRGETLYGIALDHGLEYRELADWNRVTDPTMIGVGQVLRLRPPAEAAASEDVAQARPVTGGGPVESRALGGPPPAQQSGPAAAAPGSGTPAGTVKTEPRAYKLPYSEENLALMSRGEARRAEAVPPKPEPRPEPRSPAAKPEPESDNDEKIEWGWPAPGKVLAGFSDPVSKGLDISGKIGDPVVASASGRVVYSGSGLRGYGKLVIVKHNKSFLTAYGHNSQILVKEGQNVLKGQKIAEIGDSDADAPKLHFEIRHLGKPVDPGRLLPGR
jgi:lipoprotein NlpD